MNIQLTEKEQELLVLEIVKACIQFAADNQKSFEEVLNEDLFPDKASTDFAEMICKTIEKLNQQGDINGTVELEYEMEYDFDDAQEEIEETSTDAIDFDMCTFEDISISLKGKARMSVDSFKEMGKDYLEKTKPLIKVIGSTVLQTVIETAVVAGLKAAGFPVVA